ncbi:DUF3987 domain-containing protein [Zavarzinella formosa]|uniref:DUF3987 domain-containing protein n=1 Tax=Zavarzinella formosa TaxID=360055 RepID=UPI0002EB9CEC|nr:DUF3987 domain-containing protein [Zavarzinella formosa]
MAFDPFPTSGDALSAARWYRDRGFMPVPIPRQGGWKSPVILKWQQLRPTVDDLPRLFPARPACNIGLLLGEPSEGLIDVDLDAPEAIRAGNLLLPKTGWISGRRGKPRSHWWYRVGAPPQKASDKFLDVDEGKTCLVELRSTGGQTVVPPGIHISGEAIEWDEHGELPLIELPVLRRAVTLTAGVALLARHWPGPGSRQDAFLALAGALCRDGFSHQEAGRVCSALACVTGDEEGDRRLKVLHASFEKGALGLPITGWTTLGKLLVSDGPGVIRAILGMWKGIAGVVGNRSLFDENLANSRGILNYGDCGNSGKPVGENPAEDGGDPWPELVEIDESRAFLPFPADALPESLGEYVRQLAWCMNAPPDYAGAAALTVAAGVVGNALRLRITPTHHQPALLFTSLVGVPGAAKSPVTDHFGRALDDRQREFNDRHRRELAEWKKRERANPGEDDQTPRPELRIAVARETTTESLTFMLLHNPRGFPLLFDELSGLFQGLNQYKGGSGNDRQVYLSVWSQATIDHKRKADLREGLPPIFVRKPCVSILGGIQPDLVRSIRSQTPGGTACDDGGLDRFLFCWPELLPEIAEEYRELEPGREDCWSRIVTRLGDDLPGGETTVRLSAEAKREWREFTRRHANEVNRDEFPSSLRGPWKKLRAYACRLALVLHALDWAGDPSVDLNSLSGSAMRRGADLVAYFKDQFRKVVAFADRDERLEGVRRVRDWIVRKKQVRFQKRDLYQSFKGTWKTIEELDPVLESAERYHVIRLLRTGERGGAGRKPSPWYESHPSLSQPHPGEIVSHNSQNRSGGSEGERMGKPVELQTPPENKGIFAKRDDADGGQNTGSYREKHSVPQNAGDQLWDSRNHPDLDPTADSTVLKTATGGAVDDNLESLLRELEELAIRRTDDPTHLRAIRTQLNECRADARRGNTEAARVIAEGLRKTLPECLDAWTGMRGSGPVSGGESTPAG